MVFVGICRRRDAGAPRASRRPTVSAPMESVFDARALMPLGNTPLPTADDFVQQHAELLQVMNDVRKRNRGGRHDKHDTARLRYIKDIALRGLRFGKMVPPVDVNMIRLPPKAELRGADLAAMDAWAKRHAPDPRSANQGAEF